MIHGTYGRCACTADFFADMSNQQIHMRHDAFHVDIPKVDFNNLNHSSFSYCFPYFYYRTGIVFFSAQSSIDIILSRWYSFMYEVEKIDYCPQQLRCYYR